MAKGVIYGETDREGISVRLSWSTVPNVETGESAVTVTLSLRKSDEGYLEGDGYFQINGMGIRKYLILGQGTWSKVLTKTESVAHDADGVGTLAVGVSGTVVRADGTPLFTLIPFEGVIEPDRIPAASAIEAAPELLLGRRCPISWTPQSESFSYRLTFSMGTWQMQTALIFPGVTSLYTYTEDTIPYEAASGIPEASEGEMRVTLSTFRDREGTVCAGEHSAVLTARVPHNEETAPRFSVRFFPISESGTPDGMWVRGVCRVRAEFSQIQTRYGAEMRSALFRVEGKEYDASADSALLTGSGDILLTGIVTDSRGISREISETVRVVPYQAPVIVPASGMDRVICGRCDKDGTLRPDGTYLRIRLSGRYSSLVWEGAELNACRLYFSWRESTDADFSAKKLITGDEILGATVFSPRKSYTVRLEAVDTLGSVGTLLVKIPTDTVVFHLGAGGSGAAFGKYAEMPSCLDIDPSWDVRGRVLGLGACTFLLTAGEDLDRCTAPGTYAIEDDDIAASLKNAPFARAGRLIVSSADGTAARVLQEYVDTTGLCRGVRLIEGTAVQPWHIVCGTGWESAGQTLSFRRIGERVILRLSLLLDGLTFPYSMGEVLPESVRPAGAQTCLCAAEGGIAVLSVGTSGEVSILHVFPFSSGGAGAIHGTAEYFMT